jgi:hypothetical protein
MIRLRRFRIVVIAGLVGISVAGCGAPDLASLTYQGSPTVERFRLSERCGSGDRSCESVAHEAAAGALDELGATYTGDGLTTTDTPSSDHLFIQVMSSAGIPYSSPDGSGRAYEAMFDLTAVRGTGTPYVVVRTEAGVERYVVTTDRAEALLAALYRSDD